MAAMKWFILTILFTSYMCDAYKILVVFPLPGKSHGILGDGYVRHLLDAGHEVTYMTPFPRKDTNPRLTVIDVSGLSHEFMDTMFNIKTLMNKEVDLSDSTIVVNMTVGIAKAAFLRDDVQEFLQDPSQHFDLVIAEWLFTEVYCGLQAVFQCPYVWSASTEPHSTVLSLIDEATDPSNIPNLQSDNVPPMNFQQRVYNLFLDLSMKFYKNILLVEQESLTYEELFGPSVAKRGRTLPPFSELKYNASMVLGNSHYSLGIPLSLPVSYAAIGGYHVDTNLKPLPEDLKKIMDNAKNGVIYFSMGSNLKSKDMPLELKNSLLKMFGTLKYTVVWKFEEVLPNLPKNVHILKWAPQTSILAHPNTRLFITHGGLLSVIETIHFGKPIVGIPVFADQFANVEKAVKKGIAKRVDIGLTMADELKAAIEEILTNPTYTEKVKYLSFIYHDRPVPPGKELVHWVEHVIRTRGAPHLRSPALMVPWYQKAYLDLLVLILALLIGLIFVIKLILSSLTKKVDDKKKKN